MKASVLATEPKSVAEAFRKAKDLMKGAGYGIGGNVRVVVEPDLGFMGYTFQKAGRSTIVVSGAAVESGMLEGLLVHEMSHIYRTRSKHPSHNPRIITDAMSQFLARGFDKDYQQKILHDVVNHLEDLYADEVAFKVFGKSKMFPAEVAGKFFLSWLSPDPVASGNARRDKWVNAAIMLRNSFAISNMARHEIPDIGNRARILSERFLSGLPTSTAESFEYFRKLMIGLKEDVTEEEFRGLLSDYLEKFVRLAESGG